MNNQTPRRTNHQQSSSGKSNSQRESLNSQHDNSNLRCENALVEAKVFNFKFYLEGFLWGFEIFENLKVEVH